MTYFKFVCSYRTEGCDFEEYDVDNCKLEEDQECPDCLEYNKRNPEEQLLVGKLELVDYDPNEVDTDWE